MQITVWKSKEEIKYLLRSAQKVSILSCGICANICNTGGKIGIRILKELLEEWGKKVTIAKSLMGCCPQEIEKRGDLTALKYLSQLHEAGGEKPISPKIKPSPGFLKKLTGWVAARAQFLVGPTHWIE